MNNNIEVCDQYSMSNSITLWETKSSEQKNQRRDTPIRSVIRSFRAHLVLLKVPFSAYSNTIKQANLTTINKGSNKSIILIMVILLTLAVMLL